MNSENCFNLSFSKFFKKFDKRDSMLIAGYHSGPQTRCLDMNHTWTFFDEIPFFGFLNSMKSLMCMHVPDKVLILLDENVTHIAVLDNIVDFKLNAVSDVNACP